MKLIPFLLSIVGLLAATNFATWYFSSSAPVQIRYAEMILCDSGAGGDKCLCHEKKKGERFFGEGKP